VGSELTVSGGIIALVLFKRNWNIDQALAVFRELSAKAFSPRKLLNYLPLPVFRHSAQLLFSYKYKSQGIEDALQEAFGNGALYGQSKDAKADLAKVGVVAAVRANDKPYLFANYARNITAGTFLLRYQLASIGMTNIYKRRLSSKSGRS
jgi:hypothetical protein